MRMFRHVFYIVFLMIVTGVFFIERAPQNRMFWGGVFEGYPEKKDLTRFYQETGKMAQIVNFFVSWPALENISEVVFPFDAIKDIYSSNAAACITWEPFVIDEESKKNVNYQDILSGGYDLYIINFANSIKACENPVIVRFAHEMNLDSYHWGEEMFNEQSPEIYKKMYQYIYKIFLKQKVDNLLFAFCPNAESIPKADWNTIANFYPGDEHVDLLGVDGYNFGSCKEKDDSPNRSFEEIFDAAIADLKSLSNKPIIIFEMAAAAANERASWMRRAFQKAKELSVAGILWFQIDKECRWPIATPNERAVIKGFFKQNGNVDKWLSAMIKSKQRKNSIDKE